jgi:hypothetical protein
MDKEFFKNEMINFFQNWNYIKGQFHPYTENLEYIDMGIKNVLLKFNNEIVYKKVKVWGESLIYTFECEAENTIIEINVTPTSDSNNTNLRYGFNFKKIKE